MTVYEELNYCSSIGEISEGRGFGERGRETPESMEPHCKVMMIIVIIIINLKRKNGAMS